MIAYAKIVNEKTKECKVGSGTNKDFYESIGMTEMEVEKAHNSVWYLKGYAPAKPEPTLEERVAVLEQTYGMTRWQREGILAEGSLYSDYTKAKAQEIEELASQLRTAEKSSEVEEGAL